MHAYPGNGLECSRCRCNLFETTRRQLVWAWIATVGGIGLLASTVFVVPPRWAFATVVVLLIIDAWAVFWEAARGAGREYQQTRQDPR